MSSRTPYYNTKHYINGYKLPEKILQNMTSQRLYSYIKKKLKPELSSYHCPCCQEPYWKLYDSHKDEKEEYSKLHRYIKHVYAILNLKLKSDPLVIRNNKAKINKGCQHKKKSQKKKDRRK